ncbi:hypothetical protein K438DRAFT_1765795 [Mycena galopus ATCC 62051]|nr:hypothetical protein K438DRAFT_1782572 [Mycena galopus ATCC 62051]KAF8185572.1 hypothetical protein K438DRAFT_1765795 [Mycena galopus ATCC 62051]
MIKSVETWLTIQTLQIESRTTSATSRMMTALVTVALVIDTVSALGDYACVYLSTVLSTGDLAYLSKQNWGLPLYTITTEFVAILVQSFLVFRYWRLLLCNWLIRALTGIQFGSGFGSGLVVMLFPAFKDRTKVKVCGTCIISKIISPTLQVRGGSGEQLYYYDQRFTGCHPSP